MKNGSLEYVISGPSFTRIQLINETYDRQARTLLSSINKPHDHFSFMFNALTEVGMGRVMKEKAYPIHAIHADSGGLQMVTLGIEKTEAKLKNVFSVQGAYSDIAMCFDEIPVETTSTGGGNSRSDLSRRIFVKESLLEKAKETAANIKQQINSFIQDGSSSKVFMILQGNSLEDYMEWGDVLVSELDGYLDSIGGVALGFSANGMGQKETLAALMSFIFLREKYNQLKCFNHLHILGVGAVSRLLPYLVAMQTDRLSNIHLSYDSSSLSGAICKGLYFHKKKRLGFTKKYEPAHETIIQDLIEFAGDDLEIVQLYNRLHNKGLEKILSTACTKYEDPDFHSFIILSLVLSSVNNFKKNAANISENFPKNDKMVQATFNMCSYVREPKDFDKFIKHVNLTSNKISSTKSFKLF